MKTTRGWQADGWGRQRAVCVPSRSLYGTSGHIERLRDGVAIGIGVKRALDDRLTSAFGVGGTTDIERRRHCRSVVRLSQDDKLGHVIGRIADIENVLVLRDQIVRIIMVWEIW